MIFFLVEALLTPQNWKQKNKVTNIAFRACKTKKNVKGVFLTDTTGLKIFVIVNAMIFAFITFGITYGKNRF